MNCKSLSLQSILSLAFQARVLNSVNIFSCNDVLPDAFANWFFSPFSSFNLRTFTYPIMAPYIWLRIPDNNSCVGNCTEGAAVVSCHHFSLSFWSSYFQDIFCTASAIHTYHLTEISFKSTT